MNYDYSENILVQEAAGHLLETSWAGKSSSPITLRFWVKTVPLAAKATRTSS